jgi:hypothetical protein
MQGDRKMKLFSKTQKDFHKIYSVLGIKLKFRDDIQKINTSVSNRVQNCEASIWRMMYGDRFLWYNKNNFSREDIIRYCANKFYEVLEYFPDFKNPKTFNEKINWLKYNYYNPTENLCCDKFSAKEYISDKIGSEYIVPLLGCWKDVNDIDFEKLPEQIVFKNTISGGGSGVKIVRNKSKQDLEHLKYELNQLLFNWNNDGYATCLIPERILIKERLIAEQYIEEVDDQVYDYKFFCFNGKAKFLYVQIDHKVNEISKISFYDMDFKKAPFQHALHSEININISKPKNFNKMVEIAEKLAQDFPFVRVDLYNINGKIYVGELTFNPTGGFLKFDKVEWDYKIGEMLDLTKIDKQYLGDVFPKIHAAVESNHTLV